MPENSLPIPWHARAAQRFSDTTRGHGGLILTTVGGALTACAALSVWFLVPGLLLVVAGIVFHLRLKPSYNSLLAEAKQAATAEEESRVALQSALESVLSRIAKHCQVNETHQRVSVYCHIENEFVLLARNSTSTRLCRRGRAAYPADQGVIGTAWDKGQSSDRDWPEDTEAWLYTQELMGIPRDVALALSMRPRSMVAMRLSHDGKHIGVIVMESEQPRGVTRLTLERAQASLLLESLSEILISAAPQFPAVAEHLKERRLGAKPQLASLN